MNNISDLALGWEEEENFEASYLDNIDLALVWEEEEIYVKGKLSNLTLS